MESFLHLKGSRITAKPKRERKVTDKMKELLKERQRAQHKRRHGLQTEEEEEEEVNTTGLETTNTEAGEEKNKASLSDVWMLLTPLSCLILKYVHMPLLPICLPSLWPQFGERKRPRSNSMPVSFSLPTQQEYHLPPKRNSFPSSMALSNYSGEGSGENINKAEALDGNHKATTSATEKSCAQQGASNKLVVFDTILGEILLKEHIEVEESSAVNRNTQTMNDISAPNKLSSEEEEEEEIKSEWEGNTRAKKVPGTKQDDLEKHRKTTDTKKRIKAKDKDTEEKEVIKQRSKKRGSSSKRTRSENESSEESDAEKEQKTKHKQREQKKGKHKLLKTEKEEKASNEETEKMWTLDDMPAVKGVTYVSKNVYRCKPPKLERFSGCLCTDGCHDRCSCR